MKFTQQTIFATTLMALSICGLPAFSQSGGLFEITKSVIAGGGGNSAGGVFNLDGTTGQCVAGTTSTGGAFTLAGGFWAGGTIVGTPTPQLRRLLRHLPRRLRRPQLQLRRQLRHPQLARRRPQPRRLQRRRQALRRQRRLRRPPLPRQRRPRQLQL